MLTVNTRWQRAPEEGGNVLSIGETLARARRDAGLSVADVSNKTRIRQSVIERIEHDDYSSGGLDFFARGDIRDIAQAVGADSEQLIEEYDATRTATGATPARPTWPPAERAPQHAEPSLAARASGALRDAMADLRQAHSIWWLGIALFAVAALGGALLIVGTSGHGARPVASAQRQRRQAATHQAGSHRSRARAARSPGRSVSPAPSGSGSPSVQIALKPRTIVAFGPSGSGQGDSPQLARMALAGRPATPWHSAWYATANFGNLQSGTGLLLDMGHMVTVTGARVALGNGPGAYLNLRIGNAPVLADLHFVAGARASSDVVQLHTSPLRGRYLLVWFTKLPPDQAGTFQVSVYDIKVFGHP